MGRFGARLSGFELRLLNSHRDAESAATLNSLRLATNTSQATRVVDEALDRLTKIEDRVDGIANSAIASSATLIAEMESDLDEAIDSINLLDAAEENLLLARNQALADNALAGLAIFESQRNRVLDLLQ